MVSVIVPIYNVEKYLPECLDSILSQSLKNIEVIAVDDGSTDRSGDILDEYARRDRRLKVVHKSHGGVSEARNEAMKHVQGKYVGFLDSDDWVDREMYEVMYRTAEDKNVDIVMCGYVREFPDHSKVKAMDMKDGTVVRGKTGCREFARRMIGPIAGEPFMTENLDMHSTIWNKLYSARLLKDISFLSLKDIGSCEDLLFNLYVFNNASSFSFIDKPYYHYRKTSVSSVTNRYRPELVEQRSRLIDIIRDFIERNSLPPTFYEALNNRICLGVMGLGLNIAAGDNPEGCVGKIQQTRAMLSARYISEAFGKFPLSGFPCHWKLFYTFARSRNAVFFYIMIKAIKYMIAKAR